VPLPTGVLIRWPEQPNRADLVLPHGELHHHAVAEARDRERGADTIELVAQKIHDARDYRGLGRQSQPPVLSAQER
jgi:hypothetical protein